MLLIALILPLNSLACKHQAIYLYSINIFKINFQLSVKKTPQNQLHDAFPTLFPTLLYSSVTISFTPLLRERTSHPSSRLFLSVLRCKPAPCQSLQPAFPYRKFQAMPALPVRPPVLSYAASVP